MYKIIDIQTRAVVGQRPTAQAARALRDRLDRAYGAVRYVVRLPEAA